MVECICYIHSARCLNSDLYCIESIHLQGFFEVTYISIMGVACFKLYTYVCRLLVVGLQSSPEISIGARKHGWWRNANRARGAGLTLLRKLINGRIRILHMYSEMHKPY